MLRNKALYLEKATEEYSSGARHWGYYRPDSTSGKTFASGTGGMGLKSQADQISHTLPTTRHRCNLLSVGLGAKPRRWAPLTRDTRKGIKIRFFLTHIAVSSHLKSFFKQKFRQSMLKNALFFEKSWKNRRSVGGSAPNPRWPPEAGGGAPSSHSCYSHSTYVLLLNTAQIGIVKITTYYFILERRSCPLSQACLPGSNLYLRHRS